MTYATIAATCAHCGETFPRPVGAIGVTKVCSPECRKARRAAQVADTVRRFGRNGSRPQGPAEPASSVCLDCAHWSAKGCRRGAFFLCKPDTLATYRDWPEVWA